MGDNLDDLLDSALDDFEDIDQKSHFPPPRTNNTNTAPPQQPTATSTNVNNNSNNNTTNSNQPGEAGKEYGAPMEDTEKLVEEFQRDMNKVLEELQGPDFMKALDEMAKKMQEEDKKTGANTPQSNTTSNNNNNNASSSGDPKLTEEEEIQKKLQETLKMLTENVKKMEESASQPADPKNQDQMLEDLLKGMENDDQLTGMVENVMKQLISKDILYEPMKEMQAKYPQWLADNKSKLSAEDYQRYVQQYEYVNKIVHSYNTNANYFDEVVNLMQAMQECGQPPEELMQQMSPEGGEIPKLFGNDAPGKDGGCPMQ